MSILKLLGVLLSLVTITVCKMSCKNELNEYVDWFIALKPPNGSLFFYVSSQTNGSKWITPQKDLLSNENIIALTLNQAYGSRDSGSFYAFYNDNKPNKSTGPKSRGHLKGIINFNKVNGYWIIHSVRQFPFVDSYQYGKSQLVFGQSFICVSLDVDSLEPIVNQLLMMQSTVYSNNLPEDFSPNENLMHKLKSLIANRNVMIGRKNVLNLKTQDKLGITHFGKSALLNADLYAGVMAPNLKDSMFVESWIRGSEVKSSCDTPFKVYNVKTVNFNGISYKSTRDHSKWVVSNSSSNPFVCIGSINRMTSQFKRGGGSMCIFIKKVWNLFNDMVKDYEPCEENLDEL